MVLRRILLQVGVLAGCAAFALTLWLTLRGGHFDILQASFRAIGAGIATLIISLILSGFIAKFGGQPE